MTKRQHRRVERILKRFPLPEKLDTVIVTDTVVQERLIVRTDSFYTSTHRVDTFLTGIDGVYVFRDNMLEGEVHVKERGVRVVITKQPELIIRIDSVIVSDTVFVNNTLVQRDKIITENPLWFLEYWWILLIIAVIVILIKLFK